MTQGLSLEATVHALYTSILRRPPQPAEIDLARSRIEAGQNISELILALAATAEAKRYQTRLFVPPGHFYSPVCDPVALDARFPKVRSGAEADLPGLNLDIEKMSRFWTAVLAPQAIATPFPETPAAGFRYHFQNPAYSYGDAIILRAILLHARPKQIIEVGSGWSSACTVDTLSEMPKLRTKLTFIEPYPALLESIMWPEDQERVRIIPRGVQDVDVAEFEKLRANDVLFIDSTHVVKTGSDVVYELCEVLPRLAPGVYVHFHDIFYPFEYGREWVIDQNRSWNEIYALRNFLTFNTEFEVVFFNDMFMQLRRGVLVRDCRSFMNNSGGALWLRRVEK